MWHVCVRARATVRARDWVGIGAVDLLSGGGNGQIKEGEIRCMRGCLALSLGLNLNKIRRSEVLGRARARGSRDPRRLLARIDGQAWRLQHADEPPRRPRTIPRHTGRVYICRRERLCDRHLSARRHNRHRLPPPLLCCVVFNGIIVARREGRAAAARVLLLRTGRRRSSLMATARSATGALLGILLNLSFVLLTFADAFTIFKGVDTLVTIVVSRVLLGSAELRLRELGCGALTLFGLLLIARPTFLFDRRRIVAALNLSLQQQPLPATTMTRYSKACQSRCRRS